MHFSLVSVSRLPQFLNSWTTVLKRAGVAAGSRSRPVWGGVVLEDVAELEEPGLEEVEDIVRDASADDGGDGRVDKSSSTT